MIARLRVNSSLALLIDPIRKREAIMHLHVSANPHGAHVKRRRCACLKLGQAVFASSNASRGCAAAVIIIILHY